MRRHTTIHQARTANLSMHFTWAHSMNADWKLIEIETDCIRLSSLWNKIGTAIRHNHPIHLSRPSAIHHKVNIEFYHELCMSHHITTENEWEVFLCLKLLIFRFVWIFWGCVTVCLCVVCVCKWDSLSLSLSPPLISIARKQDGIGRVSN